jgi:ceramide glucosyltransferase
VTMETASFLSASVILLICCFASLYVLVAAFALPSAHSVGSACTTAARSDFHHRKRGRRQSACSSRGAEPRLFEKRPDRSAMKRRRAVGTADALARRTWRAVVRRPRATYPTRDIELVVDPLVHGRNLKVSNLINLATYEKYPIPEVRSSPMIARRRAGPQLPESTHFGPSRLREL